MLCRSVCEWVCVCFFSFSLLSLPPSPPPPSSGRLRFFAHLFLIIASARFYFIVVVILRSLFFAPFVFILRFFFLIRSFSISRDHEDCARCVCVWLNVVCCFRWRSLCVPHIIFIAFFLVRFFSRFQQFGYDTIDFYLCILTPYYWL